MCLTMKIFKFNDLYVTNRISGESSWCFLVKNENVSLFIAVIVVKNDSPA